MNYYAARQRKDGRWDWTRLNDGVVSRSGPCAKHGEGHVTKEEAERHFYDSELAKLCETWSDGDVQYRCAVSGCGQWTQVGLASHGYFVTPTWLCDRHRDPDMIEKLHPFKPGLEIWASW